MTNLNYKSSLQNLKSKARQEGFTVRCLKGKLKDYAGMNDLIASQIGYPDMDKKTIDIDSDMSYKNQYITLAHELREREKMSKGKKYWNAHVETLEEIG